MQTPDHLKPIVDGVEAAIDCHGVKSIDWFAVAVGITEASRKHLLEEEPAHEP